MAPTVIVRTLLLLVLCCALFAGATPARAEVRSIGAKELNKLILEESKQRPVLVNFWATWCGPCRMEVPHLVEADAMYGDDVLILGVSIDVNLRPVQMYAQKMGITYQIFQGDRDVARAFQVNAIPRTMLFTDKGMIMDKMGYMSESMLDKVLRTVTSD